jgi:tRNA(adenine34) deaminase
MINESEIIKILMKLAEKAGKKGEIPVSAVVIHNNKLISKKYNRREKNNNVMGHAEILAIQTAAKRLKRWNLSDCDLYVSLKPCQMCMEVIKQSRIKNVYYLLDKLDYKRDFSKTNVTLLKDFPESDSYQQLLSDFFQNIRH